MVIIHDCCGKVGGKCGAARGGSASECLACSGLCVWLRSMKPLCDGREASEVAMWSVGRNTGHRKI